MPRRSSSEARKSACACGHRHPLRHTWPRICNLYSSGLGHIVLSSIVVNTKSLEPTDFPGPKNTLTLSSRSRCFNHAPFAASFPQSRLTRPRRLDLKQTLFLHHREIQRASLVPLRLSLRSVLPVYTLHSTPDYEETQLWYSRVP